MIFTNGDKKNVLTNEDLVKQSHSFSPPFALRRVQSELEGEDLETADTSGKGMPEESFNVSDAGGRWSSQGAKGQTFESSFPQTKESSEDQYHEAITEKSSQYHSDNSILEEAGDAVTQSQSSTAGRVSQGVPEVAIRPQSSDVGMTTATVATSPLQHTTGASFGSMTNRPVVEKSRLEPTTASFSPQRVGDVSAAQSRRPFKLSRGGNTHHKVITSENSFFKTTGYGWQNKSRNGTQVRRPSYKCSNGNYVADGITKRCTDQERSVKFF